MGLLTLLWNGLTWLGSLLMPMFALGGRAFRRLKPWLLWVLHVVLLLAVLGLLWFLNYVLELEHVLRAPWAFWRRTWLPLLFLLFYILCWLGVWLWKLLAPEKPASDFPDIDRAWSQATWALHKAGLDLTELPVFLVLGRPAGGVEDLFRASGLAFLLRHVPPAPDAPLQVYADREAIFVTCPGASLLGRQTELLWQEEVAAPPSPGPALLALTPDEPGGESASPRPESAAERQLQGSPVLLLGEEEAEPVPAPQADVPRTEPSLVLTEADVETAPLPGKTRRLLLNQTDEVERLTARLKHLCRLLVRDRRPYCPVNGILLAIPLAATAGDTDASQTGQVCQRDLAAAREVLQLDCPVLALVCDLEKVPGFLDLVGHFPEGRRQRVLGRPFPLAPDLEAGEVPGMIESGVQWLCEGLLPNLVYKLLRQEGPEREQSLAEVLAGNIRLYQLLGEMRRRQKGLARLLTRALEARTDGPPLLGGCYLAATGREETREQAFVAGVLRQLIESQNYVSWTRTALAEDADYQRRARLGWIGIGVVVVAAVGLGYYFWPS
jgi:hypothetical protein